MIRRYFELFFIPILALALFACAPVTPTAQVVAPTPQGEFHPLTTRTGLADVDRVIAAVAGSDAEVLRSLIQFTNTKCTTAEGLGGPPKCREGEAEGIPVEVLPFLGPEGHFLRKDEIGNWAGVDAAGLYAVYEVSPAVTYEENYPAGKYAIMLVDKKNQAVISLRVDNGKIVRVDDILDTSPEAVTGWIQREASTILIAPVQ